MRYCNCRVTVVWKKAYHLNWPVTHWHLLSITEGQHSCRSLCWEFRVHAAWTALHPAFWPCLFSIVPYICSSYAMHRNVVLRRWCHRSVCQLRFWVWAFVSSVSSAAHCYSRRPPNSPELWSNILRCGGFMWISLHSCSQGATPAWEETLRWIHES